MNQLNKNQILRTLLISSGFLSLGLGLIGIVVPLLPTTPFLLLSAACFVRSSPNLYNWLLNHKILGPYIRSYREHKALSIKTKVMGISLIWISLGTSMIFFVDSLIMRLLLAIMGIGVTIHLLRFKTLTANEIQSTSKSQANPNEL